MDHEKLVSQFYGDVKERPLGYVNEKHMLNSPPPSLSLSFYSVSLQYGYDFVTCSDYHRPYYQMLDEHCLYCVL